MRIYWDSSNPFAVPYINVNYFPAPGSLNNPRLGTSPRSLDRLPIAADGVVERQPGMVWQPSSALASIRLFF